MDGNEIDRRFWQHLSQEAPNTTLTGLKKEAFILFAALDSAYTNSSKMSGLVPVDRQLIQYFAGWAEESLKDSFHGTSVIGPDANHYLKRVFGGFIQTIRGAIKENQISWRENGEIMYGCLVLPQWIVDVYTAEAEQEAAHIRDLRAREPGLFKLRVVSNE